MPDEFQLEICEIGDNKNKKQLNLSIEISCFPYSRNQFSIYDYILICVRLFKLRK